MDNKIEIPIHKQVCKKQSTRLHFFWFLFVSGITGPLFLLLVAGLFHQHNTIQIPQWTIATFCSLFAFYWSIKNVRNYLKTQQG